MADNRIIDGRRTGRGRDKNAPANDKDDGDDNRRRRSAAATTVARADPESSSHSKLSKQS